MTTAADPFHPDNLRINPTILGQSGNEEHSTKVRRYRKQSKVKFYQFDTEVLDKLFAATKCPTLAVRMALEELHFTDFDHRNPVRLTSFNLQFY